MSSGHYNSQLLRKSSVYINLYCKSIEIKPEKFIRDAVIKELISVFVKIQTEKCVWILKN